MTNFKKIGLTALAGTLAATAYAQAGALSVSGTARMEYQSSQTSANASTDSFADNSTLTFSGSGELDNGFSVSMYQAQFGGAQTSQGVTLDMGDMGVLTMTNYNTAGIGTIQDMVPNGGEQPWDDLGTHGAPEQGVASPHSGNRLGYSNTFGGANVSAAIDYQQSSPTTSLAVSMDLMDGLQIGAGIGTVFSALITSVARNPHLMKQLFGYAILGFALTEAIALFALMMAFLILFTI